MPQQRRKKVTKSRAPSNGSFDKITNSGMYQYGIVKQSDQRPFKFTVKYSKTGIATTGAGLLSEIFSINDPQLAGNWSELSALFDSFRVRKVKLQWVPSVPNDSTALYRPIYAHADFDSSTVPSTADTVLQFDTARMFDIQRPFIYEVENPAMQAANTAVGWLDVGAPLAQGVVGLLGIALTASTVYGSLFFEWDIDFKRRR